MANEELSALTTGGPITDGDLSYWAQGGAPVRQPASAVATYVASKKRPRLAVFPITGQSNGQGQGTFSLSPPIPVVGGVPQVLAYKYDGTIVAANDPVPNAYNSGDSATTGSAWPSFGLTRFAAKNEAVLFVMTAIGGTGQVPFTGDLGQNWDITGTLLPAAIGAVNSALAAAIVSGYDPYVAGILECQGERDASRINSATITQGQYITSLQGMIAAWRSATLGGSVYQELPFYIFKTGTDSSLSDAGYASIRTAQETVAAADPLTQVVFRGALAFTALGMVQAPPNAVHYTQAGYNIMGAIAAANILAAEARSGFQFSGTSLDLYYDQGNVVLGWPVSSGAPFSVNKAEVTLPAPFAAGTVNQEAAAAGGALHEIFGQGAGGSALFRTCGGTLLAPTKVTNTMLLGSVSATGYDASPAWGVHGNASMSLYAAEDWNDATHHGTMAKLRLTPAGTDTPTDYVFFNNDGSVQQRPVTFASLAAASSGNAGAEANISDSTTATFAATITGGGTHSVKGRSNGVNWTVMGA